VNVYNKVWIKKYSKSKTPYNNHFQVDAKQRGATEAKRYGNNKDGGT